MKIFRFIFIFSIIHSLAFAQPGITELQLDDKGIRCRNGGGLPKQLLSKKSKAEYLRKISDQNTSLSNGLLAPSEMTCGRFKVYFEDVTQNTGVGFDGYQGFNFQTALCDALNYLQSIFEIPTGDSSFIEILVLNSNYMSQAGLSDFLSLAGTFLPDDFTNGLDGFYSGLAHEHIISGFDPDTTAFDGLLTYNFFDYSFIKNFPGFVDHCAYDFHGLVLHDLVHMYGFISFVEIDSTSGLPRSNSYPDQQFSLMDKRSLFHGNVKTGILTQIIDTNLVLISGDPTVLAEDSLWLFDTIAPYNIGLYATYSYINPFRYIPGHFYQDGYSFQHQGYVSPGYYPPVIMLPNFYQGIENPRTLSKYEIKLLQKLGLTVKQSFLSDSTLSGYASNSSVLDNRIPSSSKDLLLYKLSTSVGFIDSINSDYVIDNCDVLVIDLNQDPDLRDADGNSLSIFPGSLYNITGCGSGGNNHNQLQISSDGSIITYTPRNNFIGRAQFGFDLFDGIERGMFVVYTIDVIRNDSCFISNVNLVINGDFEEGSETMTYYNRNVENSEFINYKTGKYVIGCPLVDGQYLMGHSGLVRYGRMICQVADSTYSGKQFGSHVHAFDYPLPSTANPLPVNNSGDRYLYYLNGQALSEPIKACNKYRINFDICLNTWWYQHPAGLDTVNILFVSKPHVLPADLFANQSVKVPVTHSATYNWLHIDTSFVYCSLDSSSFITILLSNSLSSYYLDNLSLTKEIYSYSVSAGPDLQICPGDTLLLNSAVNDNGCATSFSWNSSNAIFCPTCDSTLSVFTNEDQVIVSASSGGCSASDTIDVTFQSPPPVLFLGNDTTICRNDTLILNNSSGYPIIWQDGTTTNSIIVNGPGFYSAEIFDGCRTGYDTISVSMQTIFPFTIGNDTILCPGNSMLLTAPPADAYTWNTGQNTSAITVNQPGIYIVDLMVMNCSERDSIQVDYYTLKPDTLTDVIEICENTTTILTVPAYAQNILWNTGETGPQITVNNAGYFTALFYDSICLSNKNFMVNVFPGTHPGILQINDTLYSENAVADNLYTWYRNEDSVLSSTQPFIYPVQTGNYQLVITDTNGCEYKSAIYKIEGKSLHFYYDPYGEQIRVNGSWNGELKVRIIDLLGHVLYSGKLQENDQVIELKLTLFKAATACYFIVAESETGISNYKLPIFPFR